MRSVRYIESLSPWPEEFGLERMRRLLAELGNPQLRFPSIHVVGTNGKSTATRTIAELLRAEGLHAGSYTSPHVSGWHERLDCDPETFERAVARVRGSAEQLGATQFEVLTAAALTEFAEANVDVAVVEAGLGGRLDATNVVDAPVVLLTNVALEHTEVLGETVEEIAREKLAVAHAARIVVLSDNTYEGLVPAHADVVVGGAREAAEAFLGRPIEGEVALSLPGRLERRDGEVRDGAHTAEAVRYIAPKLPPIGAIVGSILEDKDADGILRELARLARVFVATSSSNPRSRDADELAALARRQFSHVEAVVEPAEALVRGHELAGGATVLVTGSLYLLADLHGESPPSSGAETYDASAR
jgi:dihydrofolate synthase/folylpolyglutamate synthase